ncbi:hypothetical protein NHQ30_011672 [Ciborinia camelliae]|nr:hypothetical protein NHQ30_011672 [Ciborinia camelliae]
MSDLVELKTFLSKWANCCQAVNSTLDLLHFVAVAIRKASAKNIDDMVATLLTEEDIVFRRDIVYLVRYRFPTASDMKKASRPEPQAPALRSLHYPKQRALTTGISTISLLYRRTILSTHQHQKRPMGKHGFNFDALSRRRQRVALREKFVWPLCERIPEKMRPLVEKGMGEPTEMYSFVGDHVANHMKSLSLMAVPSFENATPEIDGPSRESVLMMDDTFNRQMNEKSIPHPPSGKEYIDGTSLPPEA